MKNTFPQWVGAESQAPDARSLQEDRLDHWRHIKTRWKPPQLQSRHVRNTHYRAGRSQCFASTSRNTTQLHTISSTTQKPTLAKANACQLARVQQTFIGVLMKLPSHRKPLAQHKITLMLPVRVTRGDEVCGYKPIGLYFLESLRLGHSFTVCWIQSSRLVLIRTYSVFFSGFNISRCGLKLVVWSHRLGHLLKRGWVLTETLLIHDRAARRVRIFWPWNRHRTKISHCVCGSCSNSGCELWHFASGPHDSLLTTHLIEQRHWGVL